MIISKQQLESASEPETLTTDVYVPSEHADTNSNKSDDVEPDTPKGTIFIAEVWCSSTL